MISVLDILTLECWVASRWRCQVEAGNVDLASERRQGRRQNKSHYCREDSGSMEHGVGDWVGGEGKEREGVREESPERKMSAKDRRKKWSLRRSSHRNRRKSRRE